MNNSYYKDRAPEETIADIKKKLVELGVETEEKWIDSGISEIYSLRVTICNSSIGANGKGTTKEFAEASAYAELIERLSNFISVYIDYWKRISLLPDAKKISIKEITESDIIFDEYNKHEILNEACHAFNNDYQETWCLQVKSILSGKSKLLPSFFLPFFGSNGMGAGNTYEEFAVQAISEIFERYSVKNILNGINKAPYIDLEKIKQEYPKLYCMAKEIEKDGAAVIIRDCSLGKRLPVFAVTIKKADGSFSIAFGSHPHFEYAVERCFTEALQGQNISKLKNNTNAFSGSDFYNLISIYKVGCGSYPDYMFEKDIETSDYWFLNNHFSSTEEMYLYYKQILLSNEWDAYFYDNSYLGLSSGQFFVPEISDIFRPDQTHYKYLEISRCAADLFNSYSNLSDIQKKLVLECYEFMLKNNIIEKDIEYVSFLDIPSNLTLILVLGIWNIKSNNINRGKKYLDYVYNHLDFEETNIQNLHSELNKIIYDDAYDINSSYLADIKCERKLSDTKLREELFKKLIRLKSQGDYI